MGAIIATFEPADAGMQSISIIALIAFIAFGVGAALLLRQKSSGRARNTNMLLAMLLFFASMIALGTFIFNSLTQQRVGTVIVYENGIQLGKTELRFANIQNATIEASVQPSLLNPGVARDETEILLIADKNRKTWALSEDHYPVREVLATMRAALQEWETENN